MPVDAQAPRINPDIIADTTTGNRVATHMAAGGGWQTSILLINLGSTLANYIVRFYGDSGSPQAFSFVSNGQSLGTQSVLTGTIPIGGLVSFKAQNVDSTVTTGWALIDPSSTGDIGGLGIFTYQPTGQQAVVPIESPSTQSLILAFDNSGGPATGFALVNPHANSVVVNVVFRDSNGAMLLTDQFTMSPLQHMSFVLPNQYPGLAGQFGTALISTDSADDGIAALGILASSAGAYTTIFALAAH